MPLSPWPWNIYYVEVRQIVLLLHGAKTHHKIRCAQGVPQSLAIVQNKHKQQARRMASLRGK